MNQLTSRERELVALGAALGSNCVPCIEHHIPEARKVGLTDLQIREAIELADSVRQVPARKVLGAARQALGEVDSQTSGGAHESAACAELGKPGAVRCC